jgi:hypothetical protein
MDFGHKRKSIKYLLKKSTKLKQNPNQTLENVLTKTPKLDMYNAEDMKCLAKKWLSRDDKVTLILYLS